LARTCAREAAAEGGTLDAMPAVEEEEAVLASPSAAWAATVDVRRRRRRKADDGMAVVIFIVMVLSMCIPTKDIRGRVGAARVWARRRAVLL
jgi:hypothetical protein